MKESIKNNSRKWLSLFIAIIAYYFIHEGAHYLYAKSIGTFEGINIMPMGLGVQIQANLDKMTDTQIGIFCIVAPIATLLVGYILVLLSNKITKSKSLWLKSICFYSTVIFLFLDPIYLSILYPLFGGGDMNGISLIAPESLMRAIFTIILIINILIFKKLVLPKYKNSFKETNN